MLSPPKPALAYREKIVSSGWAGAVSWRARKIMKTLETPVTSGFSLVEAIVKKKKLKFFASLPLSLV